MNTSEADPRGAPSASHAATSARSVLGSALSLSRMASHTASAIATRRDRDPSWRAIASMDAARGSPLG
jgi:hypothetical protein